MIVMITRLTAFRKPFYAGRRNSSPPLPCLDVLLIGLANWATGRFFSRLENEKEPRLSAWLPSPRTRWDCNPHIAPLQSHCLWGAGGRFSGPQVSTI
jgi:hypothetical protein